MSSDATWPEVRRAYHRAIAVHHPDVGGQSAAAAAINEAFELLKSAHVSESPPVRSSQAAAVAKTDMTTAGRGPQSVIELLVERGETIGSVGAVDQGAGIVQIMVGDGANAAQLTAFVGASLASGTSVEFVLEPLGSEPPPSIDTVVAPLLGTS